MPDSTDFRLLATAQPDELREKAEWEAELDDVPIYRRALSLGETCFILVLMMATVRVLIMLAYVVSPTIALEDNANYVRYPFMAAALAYVAATMLRIDLIKTFFETLREADFIIAAMFSRLSWWWEGQMVDSAKIHKSFYVILWSMAPMFLTQAADEGDENGDTDPEDEMGLQEFIALEQAYDAWKESRSPQELAKSPLPPDAEDKNTGRLSTGFYPWSTPSPMGAEPHEENEPQVRQSANIRNRCDPPLTAALEVDALPRHTDDEHDQPAASERRVLFILKSLFMVTSCTAYAIVLAIIANPWNLAKACRSWISARKLAALRMETTTEPQKQKTQLPETTGVPSRRESQLTINDPIQEIDKRDKSVVKWLSSSTKSKLSSYIATPTKSPSTFPSPGSLWPRVESRLREYQALAKEMEDVTDNWPTKKNLLKPSLARKCLAEIVALRNKIADDQELLYVELQWGAIPTLDSVVASLDRQATFLKALQMAQTPHKAVKFAKTPDEIIQTAIAPRVGVGGSEQRSPVYEHVREVCSPSDGPLRTKRIRLASPDRHRKDDPIRKQIEGERAAAYWTHEMLHMKDVSMHDHPSSKPAQPAELLRMQLHELMRQATTLAEAYVGVPAQPFTVDSLKTAVEQKLPVFDLVFRKSDLIAKLERQTLEHGLLSIGVLEKLETMHDIVERSLQHAIALDDDLKFLQALPDTKEAWLGASALHQTESLKAFMNELWTHAVQGHQNDLHALRDRLNAVHSERCKILQETEDVLLPAALEELHQQVLLTQMDASQLDIQLTRYPHEDVRIQLQHNLKGLLNILKMDATVLSYRPQCQVSGPRDAVYAFGRAVAQGLQPSSTSRDNMLSGPRALVMSLQAIGALPWHVKAEEILQQMYSNSSAATMEQAEMMNNCSVEQLHSMLGFMVDIGLLKDKYQLGVVFEDCVGGPWSAEIFDHGSSDSHLTKTVWIYNDNAVAVWDDQQEWEMYRKRYRNTKWWPLEAEAVNKLARNAGNRPTNTWSGFTMPSFNNPKLHTPWGLVENVPDDIKTWNAEKKAQKDIMDRVILQLKTRRAKAEVTAEGKKQEMAERGGEDILQMDSDGESIPHTPTSPPPDSKRQKGERASSTCPQVCKYFQTGSCKNGDKCNFAHTLATDETATAPKHDKAKGKKAMKLQPASTSEPSQQERPQSRQVCKFFESGDCKSGDMCRFSHAQDTEMATNLKHSRIDDRKAAKPKPGATPQPDQQQPASSAQVTPAENRAASKSHNGKKGGKGKQSPPKTEQQETSAAMQGKVASAQPNAQSTTRNSATNAERKHKPAPGQSLEHTAPPSKHKPTIKPPSKATISKQSESNTSKKRAPPQAASEAGGKSASAQQSIKAPRATKRGANGGAGQSDTFAQGLARIEELKKSRKVQPGWGELAR